MDFSLTEEQAAIREMAEAFAQDEVAPQAIEWDQAKHFPVDVLKSAMALGLGGIMVSDAHGGSGLGRVEATGDPACAQVAGDEPAAWAIDGVGRHHLVAGPQQGEQRNRHRR